MALAFLSNLTGPDLILILLVLLLLFGAKMLPGLAKGMSEALREIFRIDDKEADETEEKEIQRPPVVKPPRNLDILKVIAGPLVSL